MPQTHRRGPASGLPAVPVAVFLPPPHHTRAVPTDVAQLGTWYGVTAQQATALIARYTQPHDLVADLDNHPMIARATQHLDRCPITLPTETSDDTGLDSRQRIVGLLFVRLPRPTALGMSLDGMAAAMYAGRSLLRPGGYLLVALTTPSPRHGSHRATVITAARAAGLSWRQEFLAALAPLPEHEPRAMPDTAAATPPSLIDGRHAITHVTLLAFRRPSGGDHA